jgi:hypothetical protein
MDSKTLTRTELSYEDHKRLHDVHVFFIGLLKVISESKVYPYSCGCCEGINLGGICDDNYTIDSVKFDKELHEFSFEWNPAPITTSATRTIYIDLTKKFYEYL